MRYLLAGSRKVVSIGLVAGVCCLSSSPVFAWGLSIEVGPVKINPVSPVPITPKGTPDPVDDAAKAAQKKAEEAARAAEEAAKKAADALAAAAKANAEAEAALAKAGVSVIAGDQNLA